MDDYRMLAEHFGKSDKVRVIITGTEAKTDGDTIYLPENVPQEVQGLLLATLLHEAYHIRYTDGRNVERLTGGAKHKFEVLNVLEDIRLDRKVHEDYPNAKNLYFDLLEYLQDKHGETIKGLPWEVQALKRLVVKSYGNPELFKRFEPTGNKQLDDWFDKHEQFAQEVIKEAHAAPDTEALVPLVDKILDRLFPEDEKREQQKQEALAEAEAQQKEGKQQRQQQKQMQDQGKDAHAKAKALDEQAREEEKEAARDRAQAKQKRQDQKQKEQAGDKTGAEQAGQEAEKHEQQAQQHEQKAQGLNKQAEPHYKKLDELGEDYKKAKTKAEKAEQKAAEAKAKVDQMRKDAEAAQAQSMSGLNEIGMGFDKIDSEDLKIKKLLPENIEDEVLAFLRAREERKVNTHEGQIDPKKLPTYFNPDNLFLQTLDDAHFKTRVHFLVDISGSMGDRLDYNEDEGSKHKMAAQAVVNICKAIEKGINMDGLEIEYGIFGFDDTAHKIKDFDQALNEQEIVRALSPRGGTNPTQVIQDVEEKYQPDNARTKQVVFMLTDGQFGQDSYRYLEQRLGGHIKWVFLGIGADIRDDKSREVFGKYNIMRGKDMKKALGKALMDNID